MIGEVRLACKHWLNDVRSQEQKLLIVATLLAALTMAMVSSFSDRLSRTMEYRATELIAGDVTLSSTRVIPEAYLEHASALGLNQSQALGFSTMAFANDQLQLVRVRAVDGEYPLKGRNHVGDNLDIAESVERTLKRGPEKGEVWAERQVLTRLGLNLGDEIELGDAETATLLYDKVNKAHETLIKTIWPSLIDGSLKGVVQDESNASYWEGRKPSDGIIDTKTMSKFEVDRLVRATTRPYPGAYLELTEELKKVIWRGSLTGVPGAEELKLKDGVYYILESSIQ